MNIPFDPSLDKSPRGILKTKRLPKQSLKIAQLLNFLWLNRYLEGTKPTCQGLHTLFSPTSYIFQDRSHLPKICSLPSSSLFHNP